MAGENLLEVMRQSCSFWPPLRVSDPEVLRIVLSMGPTEAMHFQTWQDKAGNASAGHPPLTVVDPMRIKPARATS